MLWGDFGVLYNVTTIDSNCTLYLILSLRQVVNGSVNSSVLTDVFPCSRC